MSIFEFLQRLEADPFDPALTALFDAPRPEADDHEGMEGSDDDNR